MEKKQFDLAIHLVGGQPYPNLMGMRDLNAKRHLLLASDQTFAISKKLEDFARRDGVDAQIVKLSDPNDMDKIITEFTRQEDFVGKKVAVNATGGTKPMAFAAMLGVEGKRCDVDYFYYDTQFERRFHWPIKSSERRTEATAFSHLNFRRFRIDDFTRLFDYPVNPPKEDYDLQVRVRAHITKKIWDFRRVITGVQSNNQKTLQQEAADLCSERNEAIRRKRSVRPVSIHSSSYSSKYDQRVEVDYDEGKGGRIVFNGFPINIQPNFDEFPDYLGGKWFEEYVYVSLKNARASGRLLEVRPSVSVRSESSPNFDMQEFDLLATDGVRLFVVECKAGNVIQEHVVKLDKLASDYAGVFGIGVLVAQKYQNDDYENIRPILEKIDNSKSVYCFHGDKSVALLEKYMPDLGTPKGPKGQIFN